MDKGKIKLKVLLIQNNPEYKQPEKNVEHLKEMVSKYTKNDNIDLILFTEMALTGYFFDSYEDIYPYTEYNNEGKAFTFCSELAKKLNSYVFMGFPEKIRTENKGNEKNNKSNLYNSLMVVNKKGELITSYHKVNLFKDDKKWATPGNEFGYIELEVRDGKKIKVALSICLDIWLTKDNNESYEFPKFCYEKDVDLIMFPTNWASSNHSDNSVNGRIKDIKSNWLRNFGYICIKNEEEKEKNKNIKNMYFLAADRTGRERNVDLLGCSCIVKINERMKICKLLDKYQEGIIEDTIYI